MLLLESCDREVSNLVVSPPRLVLPVIDSGLGARALKSEREIHYATTNPVVVMALLVLLTSDWDLERAHRHKFIGSSGSTSNLLAISYDLHALFFIECL